MSAALAGLDFVNGQPDLLTALQNNVRRIYKAIEKKKGKRDELCIQLAWTHAANGAE